MEIFEGGANEGVTRLLTAFYFRQSGIQGSEATFEFTHKSFGEYLTARRLVLELQFMQQQLVQHQENPDFGWNEKECLKRWTILCGPTAMDDYLLSFLRDEVKLQPKEQVQQWQTMLCNLIGTMLRHGMPLEELIPRPTFIEETKQARNASEALLAALSSCAWVTETLSTIDWPNPEAFGTWLAHLQGQRAGNETPAGLHCLNHLNLDDCNLVNQNLDGASLDGASLDRARLDGASLDGASLDGASLDRARLDGASLDGARLDGASLDGASLDGASLAGASLDGASLDGASLDGASLDGARLVLASLARASLARASLDGARLVLASLARASLARASLDGASLAGASLARASLKDLEWNEETRWDDVTGLETAQNVPEQLKQQLGLP